MDDWAPVKKSARATYPGLLGQAQIHLTHSEIQVKKDTEQSIENAKENTNLCVF